MSNTEQNRQIVQEGLNKRKSNRNKALAEAEQEKLTIQMFYIVNQNASDAEVQKKKKSEAAIANKKKQVRKTKLAAVKRQGKAAIIGLWASVALFGAIGILYVTGITEMWSAIATAMLAVVMFAFNVYALWKNAGDLAELL